MSEQRIEGALRAGPPDDPAYEPLGMEIVSGHRRPRASTSGRARGLAAAGLTAAAILAVALYLRIGPSSPDPGGMLPADIRASGQLRVVVTSGSPQVFISGGSYQGFDIDVARALAERLGTVAQIDVVDPAVIDRGAWAGRWDVAIDSAPSTAERAARFALAKPYYWRFSAVIVPAGSPIQRATDLNGRTICVLSGSLSGRWLRGSLDLAVGTLLPPPTGTSIRTASTSNACLAEIQAGTSAAFVVDWAYEEAAPGVDFAVAPVIPFSAPAGPAVDPARPESASLVAAINRTLDEMRGDGSLRRLSERRFGGQDLTLQPGT